MEFESWPEKAPKTSIYKKSTKKECQYQAAGIRLSLPPVSYAKALDVWLGVCMLFLFGNYQIVNCWI